MRPIPIPTGWETTYLDGRPVTRKVFSAPNGDLTDPKIAPVEALIWAADGTAQVSVMWILEAGDLERLAAGHAVFFTSAGGLTPHSMQIVPVEVPA